MGKMKNLCPLLVCFFAFLFNSLFFSAYAGQKSREYSVDELVARALEKYELISANDMHARALFHESKRAGGFNKTELSINGGTKHADGSKGYHFGIGLSQNFDAPGKRILREEIMQFETFRARLDCKAMKCHVKNQTIRLAFRYATQLQKLAHIEGRLKRFKIIGAYLRGRRILSPQRIVEKNIVQGRIRVLEKELVELKRNTEIAFHRLNLYTRLPDEERPGVKVSWYAKAPELNKEDIIKLVNQNNCEIQKRILSLNKAEKELELAKKSSLPDFGVSAFYEQEKLSGTREDTIGGGLSLSIPLFTKSRHETKKARFNLKKEELKGKNIENETYNTLNRLFSEYHTAGELVLNFSMKDLGLLERNMRYADMEFKKGRVELQTYLEMDEQTHSLMEIILESQLRLVDSYTNIMFLTGKSEQQQAADKR